MSVLTDVKLYLTRPNATLFPYLAEDENVKMHGGFLAAHQLYEPLHARSPRIAHTIAV